MQTLKSIRVSLDLQAKELWHPKKKENLNFIERWIVMLVLQIAGVFIGFREPISQEEYSQIYPN